MDRSRIMVVRAQPCFLWLWCMPSWRTVSGCTLPFLWSWMPVSSELTSWFAQALARAPAFQWVLSSWSEHSCHLASHSTFCHAWIQQWGGKRGQAVVMLSPCFHTAQKPRSWAPLLLVPSSSLPLNLVVVRGKGRRRRTNSSGAHPLGSELHVGRGPGHTLC